MKDLDNNKASPIPDRLKKNQKIAIITDNDVEDIEFFYPYYRFNEAGYDVDVITVEGGEFEGKHGIGLKESKSIDEVNPDDYELLYLPGGFADEALKEDGQFITARKPGDLHRHLYGILRCLEGKDGK